MKSINKKIIVTILVIIEILLINITYKSYSNRIIDEKEIENKRVAIKVDNGNNEYEDSETLPGRGYVLNKDLTECYDPGGNKVVNPNLTSNGESVTIKSNKTLYCTLYYIENLGIEIKKQKPNGLKLDKIRGGMYRFQGQTTEEIDNYICFGTSDKDTCVNDTDHYMYRIIGIDDTGKIKVIKKEALNKIMNWWDNHHEDIEFPDSNIYKSINGLDFLENENYIPKGWKEKIFTNTWLYGDMFTASTSGANQNSEGVYEIESGQKETYWYIFDNKTQGTGKWNKKFKSKISLMYVHDYYYALSDDANCTYEHGNYDICKNSWIHLLNNDDSAISNQEYLMIRYGYHIGMDGFLIIGNFDYGVTDTSWDDELHSVRPVFYIDATETLKDGEGTIDNPYIIS